MYSFVDAHCDTAVKAFEHGQKLYSNDLHLDLKRMLGYGPSVQIFAVWLNKKYYDNPFEETRQRIEYYYKELEENKGIISHAKSWAELQENRAAGKLTGLLSLEGAEALEGSIENLRYFYDQGVRAITLTWNYANCVGCGAGVEKGGLTEFGREVIGEMERLGMMVDVSHLNDDGFWEVSRLAQKPFFASHSNSRKCTNVKRNLTDPQLKAIAEKGGMIGMNLCGLFLSRGWGAGVQDVLTHIEHISRVIGFEHIGFGFDLDGIDDPPRGIKGVQDTAKIMAAMEKKFGAGNTAKICSENFLDYFSRVL